MVPKKIYSAVQRQMFLFTLSLRSGENHALMSAVLPAGRRGHYRIAGMVSPIIRPGTLHSSAWVSKTGIEPRRMPIMSVDDGWGTLWPDYRRDHAGYAIVAATSGQRVPHPSSTAAKYERSNALDLSRGPVENLLDLTNLLRSPALPLRSVDR